MSNTDLDYLKLEGNISGEDLLKKAFVSKPNYSFLLSTIKEGAKIRFIDFSNVKVRDFKQRTFGKDEWVENMNMVAIEEILRQITQNQQSLACLKALSLQNVEYNQKISDEISRILSKNLIEDLYLNGCQIGLNQQLVDSLALALIPCTNLKGIELNNNSLSDNQGVTILTSILKIVSLPESNNPMKLSKLCLKNNSFDCQSAILINKITMKC